MDKKVIEIFALASKVKELKKAHDAKYSSLSKEIRESNSSRKEFEDALTEKKTYLIDGFSSGAITGFSSDIGKLSFSTQRAFEVVNPEKLRKKLGLSIPDFYKVNESVIKDIVDTYSDDDFTGVEKNGLILKKKPIPRITVE